MKYEEKMRQRHESNALFSVEMGDFDFPIPLTLFKIKKKNHVFSLCSLFPMTYFDQISPNL